MTDDPLAVTGRVTEMCRSGGAPSEATWRRAALRRIRRHGSSADAATLLPVFLTDPAGLTELLPVLACHGDGTVAERLLARFVADDQLCSDGPADVLHALGYLGHEPATRLLWRHALDDDWELQRAATLGLVHLSCVDIVGEIENELLRHRGAALFPEFLPALAAKTGDPDWPTALLDWGTRRASTDCNGGLLLGLALLGESGRSPFDDALWSPLWEAHATATGSVQSAYCGALVQGFGIAGLVDAFEARVRAPGEPSELVHAVRVLTGLLDMWLNRDWTWLRGATEPPESAGEVHRIVFERGGAGARGPLDQLAHRLVWQAREAGVTELKPGVETDEVLRGVYELRRRLADAADHEVELESSRDAARLDWT